MILVRLVAVVAILSAFTGCSDGGYKPCSGDLVFVMSSDSEFSEAITESTAAQDSLKFDHVAIVAIEHDVAYVIEASSRDGVIMRTLDEFLKEVPLSNGRYGVVFKRLTKASRKGICMSKVIENAKRHIGEEYDWYFMPDNGRQYCSELVFDSFVDANGDHLFEAVPMNFRNVDGTMPYFWVELFRSLGTDIPEGVPGTNPGGISKSACLIEVCRFPTASDLKFSLQY